MDCSSESVSLAEADPLKTDGEANRRLALGCLVGLTFVFSSASYLLQQSSKQKPESLDHPPKFVTEIPNATDEEWMLLPGVGEKTASTWRKDSTPIESLEDLHGVGPVRAEKLKPFVSNLAPRPPKNKSNEKLPNASLFNRGDAIDR